MLSSYPVWISSEPVSVAGATREPKRIGKGSTVHSAAVIDAPDLSTPNAEVYVSSAP